MKERGSEGGGGRVGAPAAGDLSTVLSLLPNQGIRELKYISLFTQLLCGETMVQIQALGIHIPYFSPCAKQVPYLG